MPGRREDQETHVDEQQRRHAAQELDDRDGRPAHEPQPRPAADQEHQPEDQRDDGRRGRRCQRAEQALGQKGPGRLPGEEFPEPPFELARGLEPVDDPCGQHEQRRRDGQTRGPGDGLRLRIRGRRRECLPVRGSSQNAHLLFQDGARPGDEQARRQIQRSSHCERGDPGGGVVGDLGHQRREFPAREGHL